MHAQEDIDHQLNLLVSHRRTLKVRLIQLARVGRANARPEVFHDIDDAREGIREAKRALRAWDVPVEDLPGDDANPITAPSIAVPPENLVFRNKKHLYSLFTESPFTMKWMESSNFEYLLVPELEDCSVECDIRIVDDNDDAYSWAGFRVRGFRVELDHIGLGYLTYLRSLGTVEVFRKTKTIGGEGQRVVATAKDTWVKVRMDIASSRIAVWANEELHISREDRSFGGPGFLCLHTYYATAQFQNLHIYQIEQ